MADVDSLVYTKLTSFSSRKELEKAIHPYLINRRPCLNTPHFRLCLPHHHRDTPMQSEKSRARALTPAAITVGAAYVHPT
jgi:hypothetical protein